MKKRAHCENDFFLIPPWFEHACLDVEENERIESGLASPHLIWTYIKKIDHKSALALGLLQTNTLPSRRGDSRASTASCLGARSAGLAAIFMKGPARKFSDKGTDRGREHCGQISRSSQNIGSKRND